MDSKKILSDAAGVAVGVLAAMIAFKIIDALFLNEAVEKMKSK